MLTTVNVKNYGNITFYLSVETTAFNYSNMTRNCSVRLYAEGGVAGEALRSDGADGSVTIFGKTFVLPQNITVNSPGMTTIGSWLVTGISDSSYPSSTSCHVSLTYSGEQSYVYPYSSSFIVDIGAMHLTPVVSVVGGPRSELGSFIEFSGDVLDEGYEVNASVKYSISTYYMYNLQNKGNGFYSELYWIADAKNSTYFDATVTISAKYKGVSLPNTYSLTVTFYLAENAGLPNATINTGFRSENAAVQSLNIGVKNKASFFVEVSDLWFFYGASLRSCIITIDGQEFNAESAETPILTESGEHTWSVTLRDSRWKTRTYSGVFTVHDYGLPEFTISIVRADSEGNETKDGGYISITVTPEKEYSFDGANPYAYSFTYRAIGSAESSGEIPLVAGEPVLHNAMLESAVMYEVTVRGQDSLGSETVKRYVVSSERVELNIAKNKVAVGKKAQKENVFECAWDIEGNGDISFIDGSGIRKSIRNIYENEMPACSIVSVSDEDGIASALQSLSSTSGRGCFITLINVEKDGLSLEKGICAYLSFRTDGQTLVKKL